MKYAISIVLLGCLMMTSGRAIGELPSDKSEPVTIGGRDFRAIEVAVKELRRVGLEPDPYKIAVISKRDALIVIFMNPARKPSYRGRMGPLLEYEVEMNAQTLSVTKAQYVK